MSAETLGLRVDYLGDERKNNRLNVKEHILARLKLQESHKDREEIKCYWRADNAFMDILFTKYLSEGCIYAC